MSNLLMLLICMAAGMVLRRWNRVPETAHVAINAVIVHVSLPALTLRDLHDFDMAAVHVLPVLMPWALFGLGALLFWWIGRALKLPRASVGALTLVGGLGNTSFVGLPMIEALHGRDGMGLGLLIDQLGSYLVLSTLGVFAAQARCTVGLDDERHRHSAGPADRRTLAHDVWMGGAVSQWDGQPIVQRSAFSCR